MFLKTISKKFYSQLIQKHGIQRVCVIGSGCMGSGIAQVIASSGYLVSIVDQSEIILDKTLKNIESSLKLVAKKMFENDLKNREKYIEETTCRIKPTVSLENAVNDTDLVIETIYEEISSKHALFHKLDKITPKKTIFASNTSSLPLEEIAKSITRKDKFCGLHFFNPVPVMKLLEVTRISTTSDETFNTLLEFGKSIRKITVSCKDTPGFIVNRMLIQYLSDSLKLYERGDASFKDIDVAMKLGAGYLIGPFELLDHIGLDVIKFILDAWNEPNSTINKLVSENKLGRKTGEGFYEYNNKSF